MSHAQGHVLEMGVGTGGNLQYYKNLKSYTGVDWSDNMLLKAFEKKD